MLHLHLSADSVSCTPPLLPRPPPTSKGLSTPVKSITSYPVFTIKGLKACAKRALLNGITHGMSTRKPSATTVKLVMFGIQGKNTIHSG
jgi:hypothetical protein